MHRHVGDCGNRYAIAGLTARMGECPVCSQLCKCSGGSLPCYNHANKIRMQKRRAAARPPPAAAAAAAVLAAAALTGPPPPPPAAAVGHTTGLAAMPMAAMPMAVAIQQVLQQAPQQAAGEGAHAQPSVPPVNAAQESAAAMAAAWQIGHAHPLMAAQVSPAIPPALPPVLPPVSAEALAAGEDGGSSSDHQKGDAS